MKDVLSPRDRMQESGTACFFVLFVAFCFHSAAAPLIINSNRVHLRSGDKPEWQEFAAQTPHGRRLDLKFNASSNRTEAALFIRQDEVRQDWAVEINGRRRGKLFTMEADLVHTVALPPGALRDGENQLSIVPPRNNDDILVGEILLDVRPVSNAIAEATLDVQVNEGRAGVPCRITIADSNGSLAALTAVTNALMKNGRPQNDTSSSLAARPGIVYTADGSARIGLRAGSYTVYASRGFEYGVATQSVQLVSGEMKPVRLSLVREVNTPGMVSCDTHVHTFTHSGHGDCTLHERMLTLAGEGIEFPIATDHNTNINYELPQLRTRTRHWFTPVIGNEVTTPAGHFNILPVTDSTAVPDFRITDWRRLNAALRATPGVRVVVLNHPRNVHNNFQPFAATNFNRVTGHNRRGPEFQFDAMELLNSSAQQSDHMLVFRDWFALLNYGYRITGVGSSDSHDVSRYIVGQGRTYIESVDEDVSSIPVAVTCSNLVAGRALVSMGLLATMTVNDRFRAGDLVTTLGDEIRVRVKVLAPSWISAGRVELFANGVSIRAQEISSTQSKRGGVKADIEWRIPRPPHDVNLVAIAAGPGVTAPFWATPKPYQPTSPVWTNRVIACTNPIWVDADGDGRFTPARTYAQKLFQLHGADSPALIAALGNFDEAVSRQAAALCAAAMKLDSPAVTNALRLAKPQVRQGFADYAATQ